MAHSGMVSTMTLAPAMLVLFGCVAEAAVISDGHILDEEFQDTATGVADTRLWRCAGWNNVENKAMACPAVALGEMSYTSNVPNTQGIGTVQPIIYGKLSEPAYEIKFNIGDGVLFNPEPPRAVALLEGSSEVVPQPPFIDLMFSLTLGDGATADTFNLMWDNPELGRPVAIAKDLNRRQWYKALVHFNGTDYDIHLDGVQIGTKAPLHPGLAPNLTVARDAYGTSVDPLKVDFVRVGNLVSQSKSGADGPESRRHDVATELEFIVPAGQRQLFLDDYGVARIENLKKTLHQPVKKGAVVEPDLKYDPQVGSLQIRMAPIWDPDREVWKLYELSTPNDLHAKGIYVAAYFESKDGLHWTRPNLGMVVRNGSRDNNYMFIPTTMGWGRPDYAVYDATDPDPARRYKAVLANLGVAVSPDGINWNMVRDVPGIESGDESNFSFDEKNHLFLFTVKTGGPYGRSVGLATSKDFEHWTNHGLIFHADARDQELAIEHIKARLADPRLLPAALNDPDVYGVDVYNMGLFRYEGLYIGMPAMFHSTGRVATGNTVGFHLVQLGASRDLKTFTRVGDRKTFIGPSPVGSGAYDLTQILGPSDAILRGDELWFYYTGLKYRGNFPNYDTDPNTGAICLAVLRRDGFISLDAGAREGTVLTQPFAFPKGDLHLNVDAVKGYAVVQVCDEKGSAIAGFEASKPISGNHLDTVVSWPKGRLEKLAGKNVCLRIKLRQAQLYSYWIKGPQE